MKSIFNNYLLSDMRAYHWAMRHHLWQIAAVMAVASIGSARSDVRSGEGDQLTVHEWGTFTSIAAEDGTAVEWVPQSGPSDLPCFVARAREWSSKATMAATVRMETPVLYFYAPRQATVDVRVTGIEVTQGIQRSGCAGCLGVLPSRDQTTLSDPAVVNYDGVTTVLEPGPELKVTASNPIDDLCWACPAVIGDRLVIRGAAMEPLPEGSGAFLSVEPKRVVLLEE